MNVLQSPVLCSRPRPGEKLPVPKLFRRARTAVPAQLPREDDIRVARRSPTIGHSPMHRTLPETSPVVLALVRGLNPPVTPALASSAPAAGPIFYHFRATERHSCRPSEALHGPPDRSTGLPGAVCWPGTISASTNTRTGGEHRVKNATMLAPGAIAHARGVEWQDFGRSGAHS